MELQDVSRPVEDDLVDDSIALDQDPFLVIHPNLLMEMD